jgi:hypothetical protein
LRPGITAFMACRSMASSPRRRVHCRPHEAWPIEILQTWTRPCLYAGNKAPSSSRPTMPARLPQRLPTSCNGGIDPVAGRATRNDGTARSKADRRPASTSVGSELCTTREAATSARTGRAARRRRVSRGDQRKPTACSDGRMGSCTGPAGGTRLMLSRDEWTRTRCFSCRYSTVPARRPPSG